MLPLEYMPLTFSFALVNNAVGPIVAAGVNSVLTIIDTSIGWQTERIQLQCDICN